MMALSEDRQANPAPSFPPLFRGMAAEHPFAGAVAEARGGADPGLITYHIRPDHLSAAVLLAPESPLGDAMAMVLALSNGFADAFGALAPSETACQFDWPGTFRINGARCGALRAAASLRDPDQEPDWLVIGIDVPFFAEADAEPGEAPDRTTLWDEGCSEIEPARLLESWSRHQLIWINEWLDGGNAKLLRDWLGRAFSLNKEVTLSYRGETLTGTFLGLDERGGMVLKTARGERLLPLTGMLEDI